MKRLTQDLSKLQPGLKDHLRQRGRSDLPFVEDDGRLGVDAFDRVARVHDPAVAANGMLAAAMITPEARHGEVWFADVPGDKRRPVLILSRDPMGRILHSVICAPIASKIRGLSTEVALGACSRVGA